MTNSIETGAIVRVTNWQSVLYHQRLIIERVHRERGTVQARVIDGPTRSRLVFRFDEIEVIE